ncbi:protein-disulfide reductase DsbD domain-containing protein [Formosa algae]|uniref:Thiol:disulfide interchange protein DsbD n=1 Tax=Formosa algae TaxID=225843 RepID=A0A9X0YJB6_9FLAO|nr:protein-disulfide reductase DsbD domain-containing protein [Formosa algae]MBP1840180.1 thiol:disulfide interchange protein DsbD [Formosa algae]MDQ0335780.1 thiol:disulfide interchange protein DsbD [Formosa algae]OEI81004.1 cytochrome C biogenesis protein [Formosa algae]PNW25892.1 cytochrome C biogenesis protein [Formosa algae]
MKNIVLLLVLIITGSVNSQILEPVKWTTSVNKISDTEYELVATANVDKGWHLYSQNVPENGPIPTTFTFKGNKNFLKKGNTQEGKGHVVDDPVFEMNIKFFEGKADFKQRIRVKGAVPFKVLGTVEFMVCDDSRCLPPTEIDLEFDVK